VEAVIQLVFQILKLVAERYELDYEEMIGMFNFENASLKKMTKKATKRMEKDEKRVKKEKKERPKYLIPFCPAHIHAEKCNSLTNNGGLLTQCGRVKAKGTEGTEDYCSICASQKNYETYGTVSQRLQAMKKHGLYGYTTPKGQHPVPYRNLLKKGVTPEDVREELEKFGITQIPEEHFTRPATVEQKASKPGRKPKVAPAAEEAEEEEEAEEPVVVPPPPAAAAPAAAEPAAAVVKKTRKPKKTTVAMESTPAVAVAADRVAEPAAPVEPEVVVKKAKKTQSRQQSQRRG